MKKIVLLSITCIAVFVSCKKETVQGAQGPAGVNGTVPAGSITGKIIQTDQYYVTYTTNLNTTTVSLDGTSNTTVTDAAGNYTLTNVVPGIYDMSVNKNGCGLSKQQQISFPGNGTLHLNSSISDKATFTFTSGYVKDTLGQIKIQVNTSSIVPYRYGLLLYGKTNAIDVNNASSYNSTFTFIMNSSPSYSTSLSYSNIDPVIFPSGTIIYAKLYPSNSAVSSYYDYTNSKYIYTGCGTPLPATFTLTMP